MDKRNHGVRLCALVVMCFVLAGLLQAQAPSQLPGQTSPTTPPSPLPGQTPSGQTGQAVQQQQNQSAQPKVPSSTGENQQFIEVKFGANNTSIDPDLRDPTGKPVNSFLTPGNNFTTDFTYFQDHNFGMDRIQVLGIYRNNNDPRVDPEFNSLQRGYIKLTTPDWEFNAGDALVNYSRLTYNQNIRGLTVARKFSHGFRLLANGGVFTDRWGSIFKDYLIGQPFTRAIAGFRAEERINRDSVFGFNYSHGRDMPNSIRSDLQQFGLIPLKNDVASFDGHMVVKRLLTVDGEIAYSSTAMNLFLGNNLQKDYGARLDTNFRKGRFYFKTNYVRLMPSFLSLNARQLADLQDANFRAGVDVTDNITVEGSYRRTNNNLRGDRTPRADGTCLALTQGSSGCDGTTVFDVPEVRVSFRNMPHLGKAIMDAGYRDRIQSGPLRTVDPGTGKPEDRHVPTPFAEIAMPVGNTLLSVSWERRFNRNTVDPTQNTDANSYSGSLRSNFNLGNWTFAPMYRFQMEREEFFIPNLPNNQAYPYYSNNLNRSMLASVYVEAPKYLTLDASYRLLGATLFAECVQVAGGPPCSPALISVPAGATILLPSGYNRPAYHAALTYKFRNSENHFVVIGFDKNQNYYAIPGKNFMERVWSVTLVYRMKR